MTTKRDPDNDRGYTRPRAWHKMKMAFAPGELHIQLMMRKLEKMCQSGCPRYFLAAAIHHFIRLDEQQRGEAVMEFLKWHGGIDADFEEAMEKIFGDAADHREQP